MKNSRRNREALKRLADKKAKGRPHGPSRYEAKKAAQRAKPHEQA